jgi:gamma-glutamyltranspeptidase/glutathione hydrolase
MNRRSLHQTLLCLAVVSAVTAMVVTTSSCSGRHLQKMRPGMQPLYAAEARSDHGMVSTGSIEATRAGVRILEQGGTAVDAAVAAAFALGVSDPGGSGLGGFTYVLLSMADGRDVAIDGSTPVPYVVNRQQLLQTRAQGGAFGYLVVSLPTTLATLAHTLDAYGTIGLDQALAPAIEIAEEGYRLSPDSIAWAQGYLDEILASRYFRFVVLEDGVRLGQPGDLVCRPDLGRTLRRISDEGAETFYRGSLADEISADMEAHGGFLRTVDLARYQVRQTKPLRTTYRNVEILSFPPPGGGAEVAEALNILDFFPSAFFHEDSVERQHVLVEASRIAQIDHATMASELDRFPHSGPSYLSREHAAKRAAMITPGRAIDDRELGVGRTASILGEHTTHVSVVDQYGNVASLTQTLCRQYGAKVATPGLGFPYNCCLEFLDFEDPHSPIYLRPGGTYPTSMAPTIVRSGGWVMALGSAGSDRIPPSVTGVISNVVDRGMGIRDAVVAPRVLWNSAHEPPRVCIEIADPVTMVDADRLQSFGFDSMYRLQYPPEPVSDAAFFGGVNAVVFDLTGAGFSGVGDPRRFGFALGPRAVVVVADGVN